MNRQQSILDDMRPSRAGFCVSNMGDTHVSLVELSQHIQQYAGQQWAPHYDQDFIGKIWFDGARFCEEVWVRGRVVNVLYGETLEDLIESVNAEYGDE